MAELSASVRVVFDPSLPPVCAIFEYVPSGLVGAGEEFVMEERSRALGLADDVRSWTSPSLGDEVLAKSFLVVEPVTCSVLFVVGFIFRSNVVLWPSLFSSAVVVHASCPFSGEKSLPVLDAGLFVAVEAGVDRELPESFERCITLSVVAAGVPWSTGSVLG